MGVQEWYMRAGMKKKYTHLCTLKVIGTFLAVGWVGWLMLMLCFVFDYFVFRWSWYFVASHVIEIKKVDVTISHSQQCSPYSRCFFYEIKMRKKKTQDVDNTNRGRDVRDR
eukprot:m.73788 g.73788  ORF g.73788 m.73788 type:complete len:111 (-) comp24591_c0_seq1:969-1301(-)